METIGSVKEKLFTLETELNLFDKKISGIMYWERIRFFVHRKILVQCGLQGQPQRKIKKNYVWYLKKLRSVLSSLVSRNPFFSRNVEVVFWGHPRRIQNDRGRWEDIYCDPLIKATKNKYLYIEPFFSDQHFTPTEIPSVKYEDVISLLGFLRKFLVKVFLTERENEELYIIEKAFNKSFGFSLPIKKMATETVRLSKAKEPIIEYWLSKIKPKLIILVPSYGNENLISVAKKLFIPTAEIQHGIIGKYHMGYSFPRNLKKHTFPDYFLTFGKLWKDEMRFPIPDENVIELGFPHYTISEKRKKGQRKENIAVIISQGAVGKWLSRFAVGLSNSPLKPNGYKVLYKLHPGEYDRWEEDYPWLKENRTIEIVSGEKKLYDMLSIAKMQIGVFSTALFEGIGLGCKTYLLKLPGVENVEVLKKYPGVNLISTEGEVDWEVEELPDANVSLLFANDWEKNYRCFIKRFV